MPKEPFSLFEYFGQEANARLTLAYPSAQCSGAIQSMVAASVAAHRCSTVLLGTITFGGTSVKMTPGAVEARD